MSRHLTRAELETFCARSGEVRAMTRVAEHVSLCPSCRELLVGLRAPAGVTLSLDASSWVKVEHLEYEQKKAYADGVMAIEQRELCEQHLAVCARCSQDLVEFLEDRREIEPMLSVTYSLPESPRAELSRSLWRVGGLWSPMRAAAMILVTLGIGLVIGGSVAWRSVVPRPWTAEQRVQQPAQTATASKGETPAPVGGEAKARNGLQSRSGDGEPGPSELKDENRVTLRDHGQQLVVERRVRGMTGASEAEVETITEALLGEEIPVPAVISDLWGTEGVLRGERLAAVDLLRPRREVVRDTRPLFRWAPVRDAVSYQVIIVDSRHATVVVSGRLSTRVTEWRPGAALTRGERYSWTVTANVRGEEVISPGLSEAEWKFRIISDAEELKLKRLEGRTESHLARGILYARSGLITDSETELQKLLVENEDSTAIRRMLERLKSWR